MELKFLVYLFHFQSSKNQQCAHSYPGICCHRFESLDESAFCSALGLAEKKFKHVSSAEGPRNFPTSLQVSCQADVRRRKGS